VVATERLGVGTLDPTSNLHVVGNVHVTGNVNKLNFTDGYTIKRGANVTVFGTTDVIQEITGPHARASPPLRKYPEVAMTSSVQGGYVVTESSYSTYNANYGYGWRAFDSTRSSVSSEFSWQTDSTGSGTYPSSGNARTGVAAETITENSNTHVGSWVTLETPRKIQVSSVELICPVSIDEYRPNSVVILGSDNNSTWNFLKGDISSTYTNDIRTITINSSVAYKYHMLLVKTIGSVDAGYATTAFLSDIRYYGYEEHPPAGDTSVDTTITSQFNLPDTTGVKLYIDGDKGSTPTDYSGEGHTLTDNSESFSGNAWSFSSLATSNVTMSTGDFAMEGTHPHSVSLWFNCANVTSNATLFHVGTEAGEGDAKTAISLTETGHLGWIDGGDNQFLSSNTWHNLVYATQGGGGLRTCYLDGRKLGDVSDQDTFGEYPPFAMTTYSERGYTVSASSDYLTDVNAERPAWGAHNPFYRLDASADGGVWMTEFSKYDSSSPYAAIDGDTFTDSDGGTHNGHWNKIEMPHKLVPSYVYFTNGGTYYSSRIATNWVILGSNDDTNWDLLLSSTTTINQSTQSFAIGTSKGYKYLMFLCKNINGGSALFLEHIRFYGHKENDTTRFPISSTVLKYPHIAMTGYVQRGYVVTASNETLSDGDRAWHAFDEDDSTYWKSDEKYTSAGVENTSSGLTDTSSTEHGGEYIVLESPSKLKITGFNLTRDGASTARSPGSIAFLGKNSAPTVTTGWTLIAEQSTSTYTNNVAPLTISGNSNYFKYHAVVIRSIDGNGLRFHIKNIELLGTEEDLDIVARVGEGLDGKVANFRVYDKYLHEEQALELWDARKDQFGRATSSVSVYKGHVGIGMTTPEAAFTVMDEAEEMEEFPPRAMTGYETHMEGHGVFRIIESSHNTDGQEGWRAFEDIWALSGTVGNSWLSKGGTYNADETPASNAGNINGVLGEYLILESPYRVKMSYVLIYPRAHNSITQSHSNPPKTGKIWGSNDLNESWTEIASYENLNFGTTRSENLYGQHPQRVNIHATRYYKYIAFQVTVSNHTGSSANAYTNIQELRYFGTRERGQSTLHDGSLTLTKNLTVPSIGPSATDTRLSVPRRERLVLEYDTSTNPTTEDNTVIDTSGAGNDGTLNSGLLYSLKDRAFEFDGTNDYISWVPNSVMNVSGDWVFSFSGWFKFRNFNVQNLMFSLKGGSTDTRNKLITFRTETSGYVVSSWFGNNITWGEVETDKWYHICLAYPGGASANQKLYINGELQTITNLGSYSTNSLNIGTVTDMRVGSFNGSGSYLRGSASKIMFWNVALTAGEVKRLYDMGRGDSYHATNFQNTLVGINLGYGGAPRSALDVRDIIHASSNAVSTFTGQHRCSSAEGPLEKGLVVSAKKNKFVKLNGGLSTGPKAITIDESLPVVSLSNVAQDKACFGVVSRMEEANTRTRSETTGGLISEASKVLGDNRVIVNSVGEGAIWVCDANGPLESGDYITTSNVAGYGQKQDGEFLANYTVAKITMDCDFTASNVAVQAIKKVETLKTVTQDVWEGLSAYDRSSNTETQYINESNVVLSVEEYESLAPEEQNTYSETTIQTYYQIQRGENILDEHGMLQWEDTGATEPGYELRYLDASGQQTDEANCVHRAAFVGCTYHCG